MKIANIYPVANQKFYKGEKFGMVLAHLVKEGLYKKESFAKDAYLIMDNGLFENAQVSTNLLDLVKLAEESGLPIKEIVIPDVINDSEATEKLFYDNLKIVKEYGDRFKFMFVAQATTYFELALTFDFIIRKGRNLNLSIGVSKLSPLVRDSAAAITVYKMSQFPIHLLGLKSSFTELLGLEGLVRSCDTSQLAFIAKNEKDIKDLDVINYKREGVDIDLAVDKLDDKVLKELIEKADLGLRVYGLLR